MFVIGEGATPLATSNRDQIVATAPSNCMFRLSYGWMLEMAICKVLFPIRRENAARADVQL
jgi:hypothetical protein